MGPQQWMAIAIIVLAILGILRGIDVRIVLIVAALILGVLAGDPASIVKMFLETFSNEKFVIPICSAMGFAYVLKHTECDQHLVRVLITPVRHVRFLTIPGVVLAGFLVNIPVISQTSTAVCLGTVVVPLMRATGFPLVTIAACLCLGSSMGGELLNPGAPELNTVSTLTKVNPQTLPWVYIRPLLIPYAVLAGLLFWLQTVVLERYRGSQPGTPAPETSSAISGKVNPLKAIVPVIPLILLFISVKPLEWITVPEAWLTSKQEVFNSRLIGVAMVIGVFIAAAVSPTKAKDCAKHFFDGTGYGFANVISLIVTANCFGKGIEQVGLARVLGELIAGTPDLLIPMAAGIPCGFAAISGSGIASTQSLYGFFYEPSVALSHDPSAVGAVVSIGAAAGRTMSPVAAVVLMCANLTGVKPFAVTARVALPLLGALSVMLGLRLGGII